MTSPIIFNPQGSGKPHSLPSAGTVLLLPTVPATPPFPQVVDERVCRVPDRFPASDRRRIRWQAMIETPVRKIGLLIALFHHLTPPFLSRPRSHLGFFEEEPLCFQSGTGEWRTAAGKKPQTCGKPTAVLFDVTGMIAWLRERFPRATIHCVEAETGIPAATVENWLHRRSQPSVEHFTILISTFGPSLLKASLSKPQIWIDTAAALERRREIDAQIASLKREQLSLSLDQGAAA